MGSNHGFMRLVQLRMLMTGSREEEEYHMESPRFRILLADDNEMMRWLLTYLLRKASSLEIVGEASSGQAAIEMADQYEPDAIVAESCVHIPGGQEAFQVIRSRNPKVQIIELASFDNPESQREIAQSGARLDLSGSNILDAVLAAVFLNPA